MPSSTTNLSLNVWDSTSDMFNHSQLADNWNKIDAHDHTTGKGLQIPTGGLANDAVTNPKLATNAVTETKIANSAVTQAKLANQSVVTNSIVPGSVNSTALATGAVTNTKLGAASVTGDKIADGIIQKVKLAFNPVKIHTISNGSGWNANTNRSFTGTGGRCTVIWNVHLMHSVAAPQDIVASLFVNDVKVVETSSTASNDMVQHSLPIVVTDIGLRTGVVNLKWNDDDPSALFSEDGLDKVFMIVIEIPE